MKDSEFIDLLNLYLDHEITAVDAARLEAEVQNNAKSRRLYQQYCRMHKACKLIAVEFQAESVAGAVGQEKVVVPFEAAPNRGNFARRAYAVGAVAAAAACAAFIFVGRSRLAVTDTPSHPRDEVAVQVPAVSAPNAFLAPAGPDVGRITPAAGGIVQRPMLVSDPLLLAGRAQAEGEYAAAVAQANDRLEWIRTLQLAPLQQRVPIEDLRFDARPATLRPEARALGASQTPTEAPSEMTAFRFVK